MLRWENKIREASYTSPDGDRVTFQYEAISRSFEKKGGAFEFPDADGTFIQDLGRTGRRYPIRAIFWGDYCDVEADAFEAILGARGAGKLTLPLYGTVDVVPFGEVRRIDDLKSAANQSIVEVTFYETIGLVYPTPQRDFKFEVGAAMAAYRAAMAAKLAGSLVTDSVGLLASIKGAYNRALDTVNGALRSVADGVDSVSRTYDGITKSIDRGIDVLISDPLTLAFQTALLIQAPANYAALTVDRLRAYYSLAESLVSGAGADTSGGDREINRFHTNDLFASSVSAALALAAVNTQYMTRRQAIEAAETVMGAFDLVSEWREASLETLGIIDDAGAYQTLQDLTARTAGYLVGLSFSLQQERRITLTRARTPIDLCAELYGAVDSKLDFLIDSNDLTGSEILEIPKGREIVYYL